MPAGADDVNVYIEVSTAEKLNITLTNTEAGKYYTVVVKEDITLGDTYDVIKIRGNVTLTTPLNTAREIRWGATKKPLTGMFNIADGGNLTLCDNGTGILTIYGNIADWNRPIIIVNDGGKFTMSGGNLTGNNAHGGGVYNNGTFVMTGGSIVGNTESGVYSSGTTLMSGGRISENNGIGVKVYRGPFIMSGDAEISGNSGTGVSVDSSGLFRLSGGDIIGNGKNTPSRGGGVENLGTFNLSGGKIEGNKAKNGGGVYTQYRFTMTGGTIQNNIATENGGGVYAQSGFTMTGGTIQNNIATENGGGVYIGLYYSDVKLSGSILINGNTANKKPNNIYLVENSVITIGSGGLASGSQIGITTEKPPTANPINITKENTNQQYTQYFIADDQASYHTEYNSTYKRIVLALGATKYNLHWDLKGGIASNTYTEGDTPYDSVITVPQVTRDGYTFVGWSPTDPPQNMPANDLAFEAIWEAIPEPQVMSVWIQGDPYSIYSVTFENGGVANFNDETFHQVVMPAGFKGDVTLTTKSDADSAGLNLHKKVDIQISEPMPSGGIAIIKCKIALADVQAQGFDAADVSIYHFENGAWVKLATAYSVTDGIVYAEAKTQTFSPFALGFEKGGTTVPTEIPDVNPSEEAKSPLSVIGVLAGLGFVVAVKRRR